MNMATRDDYEYRFRAAHNPETPPGILSKLAKDRSDTVRQEVAQNPSAPGDALLRLARSAIAELRRSVGANNVTPWDILHLLSYDDDPCVRRAVALNASTPLDVLEHLQWDELEWVAADARANALPLAQLKWDLVVRYKVNPELVERISAATAPTIAEMVASGARE